ncbi:MAG: hypothetical protein WC560_06390 [Syntrophales bacterium]
MVLVMPQQHSAPQNQNGCLNQIGGDTFTKKPNILEEIAYRDTWGKGADSFIAMIYERLVLMRDLLAEDGSREAFPCSDRWQPRTVPGRNHES